MPRSWAEGALCLALLLAPGLARAQEVPPARLQVLASLDVGWALDGVSANGQPGALARLAVDLGPLELALEAHGGGPDTIDGPRVAYHVARGTVRLEALLEAYDDGEWRVPIGIALGIAGWARLTTTHDATLEATGGATTGGFTAGLVGRVQWFPRDLGGIVGLELALGADAVIPEPRFVIALGSDTTVLGTVWPLSPHAGAGLVVRATP